MKEKVEKNRQPAIVKTMFLCAALSIWFTGLDAQIFLLSSNKRTDTTIWKIKNRSKSAFWGNSTYTAAAFNLSRAKEVEFSLGRTNAIRTDYGRGIANTTTASWGFSYAYLSNEANDKHVGRFFLEYSRFPSLLIGNFVARADYSYHFSSGLQYIRPSLGITLRYLDILYHYSFKLNKEEEENLYRHGLTIRPKLIWKRKNWEIDHYIKNRRLD